MCETLLETVFFLMEHLVIATKKWLQHCSLETPRDFLILYKLPPFFFAFVSSLVVSVCVRAR